MPSVIPDEMSNNSPQLQSDSQAFMPAPVPQPPHKFYHPDSLNFWKRIPPTSEEDPGEQDTKMFADIRCQIEKEFPHARKLEKNLKFLKRCLLRNTEDVDGPVRIQRFVQMTRWFGPFTTLGESCTFLQQVDKLTSFTCMQGCAKISPFAGSLSQDQAEEKLLPSNVKVGSYLVRFSEGTANQGGFSLAVKANAAEVRHYRILGDPRSAAFHQPYNARLKLIHESYGESNPQEESYGDIVLFMQNRIDDEIEDNICCDHICPELPFNALFRGYD